MAGETLSRRALNRALLGRQLLLERRPMAVPEALEHLVGMQADGQLADPETPAPPRFLPEYDNALFSHEDGSRVVAPGRERAWWRGTLLVDGFAGGTWRFERETGWLTLAIAPWQKWAPGDRGAVAEEGERLLDFTAGDEATALRFDDA